VIGKLIGKLLAAPVTVPVEAVKTAIAEVEKAVDGKERP
jgi:hypothetical protein